MNQKAKLALDRWAVDTLIQAACQIAGERRWLRVRRMAYDGWRMTCALGQPSRGGLRKRADGDSKMVDQRKNGELNGMWAKLSYTRRPRRRALSPTVSLYISDQLRVQPAGLRLR